ncbi:MAG TPA: DMT family transporter [Candidatus Acidoferrum sp.]|nr:DMT family transporter [Candidatus Acidoferrum sp.]
MSSSSDTTRGLLWGLFGIATFSLTLPATRVAVTTLHPLFAGAGRAVVAAIAAALYLWLSRQRWPTRGEWRALALVSLGAVVGFPIFIALAMQQADASHGGVVLGILPLMTAAAGALLYRERPSPLFWWLALCGSALVLAYSLLHSHGALQWGDLSLLLAVLCAAISYAVGARLAQNLGGLQVISWALVLALPLLLWPALHYAPDSLQQPRAVWIGFLYTCFVSQFLGFWPWYKGLALGGIAHVSQVQLLQPFLTVLAAALLLGEPLELLTLVFAVLVVLVVALGRKLR